MTAKEIIAALKRTYRPKAKWMISNSFIFDPKEWESDFLLIERNGQTHEIEIKVGRNDFLLDLRKHKHIIFKNPHVAHKRYFPVFRKNNFYSEDGPNNFEIAWVKHTGPIPHRFSYACRQELIKFEDIPRHAGLIWIYPDGSVKTVKQAPVIHSSRMDLRDILLEKFYWQATSFEDKWHKALEQIELLRSEKYSNNL